MNNFLDFETYLFVSQKKIVLSINKKKGFERIYYQEKKLDKDLKIIDFELLDTFLNENIFKSEKLLKGFINNIFLIIECDIFDPFKISIKKKDYDNEIKSRKRK